MVEEIKVTLRKERPGENCSLGSPVLIKVLAFKNHRLEAGGEVGESRDTGHLTF